MTTLIIQSTIWLFAVGGLFCFSGLGYLLYLDDLKLKEFRANVRPGQIVRVLRPDGSTVRARILAKNSDFHFVAIDIDTRVQHLTAADCIFKP